MRIAMWSGPRNLSTAMMRSFAARGDCFVSDEPLYSHYLDRTKLPHPGANEIIASQSTSWQEVSQYLHSAIPDGKKIWYQKHMTHHMLDNIGKEWLAGMRHAFLIRRPEDVLASYVRTREEATLEDLGFVKQTELFFYVTEQLGQTPIVVDCDDILKNPRTVLSSLCAALDIPFTEKMLSWPSGSRKTDGVWAKYWYHSVESSTGFTPWKKRAPIIPERYDALLDSAKKHYNILSAHRCSV
jgi:hypothetical protein